MSDDATPRTGLIHLGLLYDTTDDLVSTVLPPVRRALDRGDTVCMMVGRHVVRGIRDELGDLADGILFEPPTTLLRTGPHAFFERLRAWGELGIGTLVIGQYSAFAVEQPACSAAEDGINLLHDDLPITLLCACARGDAPELVGTARRSHPWLVRDDVPIANPEFRAPADSMPVPDRILGRPALRMSFRDTSDLLRIRERVAGVAEEVGLTGDEARAAVLAVHEAAVLACPSAPSLLYVPDGLIPDADRVLEVRASPGSMSSEIRAPWSGSEPRDDGVAVTPYASQPADDPLRHIRWWCDDVSIHDSDGTRTIRVVTDPRRRLVAASPG